MLPLISIYWNMTDGPRNNGHMTGISKPRQFGGFNKAYFDGKGILTNYVGVKYLFVPALDR